MSDTRFSTESNGNRSGVRPFPDEREGEKRKEQPEQTEKRRDKGAEEVSNRAVQRTPAKQETVRARIELAGPLGEMLEYFDSAGGDSDRPAHLEDIVRGHRHAPERRRGTGRRHPE